MIIIERITEQTAASASRIYAMGWKAGYRGIVPQEYLDELSYDRWTDKLGKTGYESFRADYLLQKDGKAVATSSICAAREEAYSGWGEIMSLYVLPEEWRKGCGRTLFSYVSDELQKQGFSKIYLWVLEENLRARAFYESMGFTANGDRISANIGGKRLTEIRYVNQ